MPIRAFSAAFLIAFAAPALASAQKDITPIDELQRGTMATVTGTVQRLLDEDEFRLADESGSIAVYVGPNWVPAEVGETVTVHGFVDDGLIKEIYARELTRTDGSVVTFERRYD